MVNPFNSLWHGLPARGGTKRPKQRDVHAAIIQARSSSAVDFSSLTECSTHKRENRGDGREENARSNRSNVHRRSSLPLTDEISKSIVHTLNTSLARCKKKSFSFDSRINSRANFFTHCPCNLGKNFSTSPKSANYTASSTPRFLAFNPIS